MNSQRDWFLFILFVVLSTLALSAQGNDDTYRYAYDLGFTEGEISGRSDNQNNGGYDYSKWPEFLLAGKGFDETKHDAEVYRVAFRRGFKDGYENGYNNSVPDLKRAATGEAAGMTPGSADLPDRSDGNYG